MQLTASVEQEAEGLRRGEPPALPAAPVSPPCLFSVVAGVDGDAEEEESAPSSGAAAGASTAPGAASGSPSPAAASRAVPFSPPATAEHAAFVELVHTMVKAALHNRSACAADFAALRPPAAARAAAALVGDDRSGQAELWASVGTTSHTLLSSRKHRCRDAVCGSVSAARQPGRRGACRARPCGEGRGGGSPAPCVGVAP